MPGNSRRDVACDEAAWTGDQAWRSALALRSALAHAALGPDRVLCKPGDPLEAQHPADLVLAPGVARSVVGGAGYLVLDVAEGCGEEVATVLAYAEGLRDGERVSRCAVHLLGGCAGVVDFVFFAADEADLKLEDDVGGAALRKDVCSDGRFSARGSVEPSNMCEW
jgi:hypothetical protein